MPLIDMFHQLRDFFSPAETAPLEDPIFTLPYGVRVYAVGDIHGRSNVLAKMLSAIEIDVRVNPAPRVVEVFLGDYIDRGLYSREVIDLLIASPPKGHERVCLLGNHEEALMHFLEDPKILRDWANFGGYATLASYGVPIPESMSPERLAALRDQFQQNLPETHLAFLKSLGLTYSLGDYLFVHAGIHPDIPINEQKPEHLLWIRDPFLKHEGFYEKYIVHGHSPVPEPEIHRNRANLDISAAKVSALCCLVLEGTEKQRVIMVKDEND